MIIFGSFIQEIVTKHCYVPGTVLGYGHRGEVFLIILHFPSKQHGQ